MTLDLDKVLGKVLAAQEGTRKVFAEDDVAREMALLQPEREALAAKKEELTSWEAHLSAGSTWHSHSHHPELFRGVGAETQEDDGRAWETLK